jgi:hypothetical protein
MTFDIYVADVNGAPTRYLSTASLHGGAKEWLNPNEYFEYDNQNVFGSYGLRLVNADTGTITKIWDGSFHAYNFESTGRWLVVNAFTPDMSPYLYTGEASNFRVGPYLIDLRSLAKKPINPPFNLDEETIIVLGHDSNSYFLRGNRQILSSELDNAKISISPNSKYWVAISEKEVGIFSADNILIKRISLPLQLGRITNLTWRPDSSGLFLISGADIYSLDISKGKISRVEENLINNFDLTYLWVDSE